jgi:hypothetical protein
MSMVTGVGQNVDACAKWIPLETDATSTAVSSPSLFFDMFSVWFTRCRRQR